MNTLLSIMLQKYEQLQPLLAFLMLFLFPALCAPMLTSEQQIFLNASDCCLTLWARRSFLQAVCRQ